MVKILTCFEYHTSFCVSHFLALANRLEEKRGHISYIHLSLRHSQRRVRGHSLDSEKCYGLASGGGVVTYAQGKTYWLRGVIRVLVLAPFVLIC